MSCDRFREAASARLDGEEPGLAEATLESHLEHCRECRSWLESATRAGRLLRVSGATPPDLSKTILRDAVLPAARVARRRRVVQAGLVGLALVQWALAVPALFGDNLGMRMGGMMSAHSAHESAAWNLAIGAALLAVALKPARAAGTLPVLTTFVAVLSVLSVPDLMAGAVGVARLASHAGVVVGLLLVVLLARAHRMPGPRRHVGQLDGTGETRTLPRRSRGAA